MLKNISQYWEKIQGGLFPFLREELPPLTEKQQQLVEILEVTKIERFVPSYVSARGRPAKNRTALARAFIAKMTYNMPTTEYLTDLIGGGGSRSTQRQLIANLWHTICRQTHGSKKQRNFLFLKCDKDKNRVYYAYSSKKEAVVFSREGRETRIHHFSQLGDESNQSSLKEVQNYFNVKIGIPKENDSGVEITRFDIKSIKETQDIKNQLRPIKVIDDNAMKSKFALASIMTVFFMAIYGGFIAKAKAFDSEHYSGPQGDLIGILMAIGLMGAISAMEAIYYGGRLLQYYCSNDQKNLA
ncbi:MAG: hypothetical protein AAF443_01880 [Chlamydiota bacterium]